MNIRQSDGLLELNLVKQIDLSVKREMAFLSPNPNQMWQLLVLVNPGGLTGDSTGLDPDGCR